MAKRKNDDLDIEETEDEEGSDKQGPREKRAPKRAKKEKRGFLRSLPDETVQGIFAVVFLVLSIFIGLTIWDKAGRAGYWTFWGFYRLLGVGYYLLPLIFIVLALTFLRNLHKHFDTAKLYGSALFLVAVLGIIEIVSPAPTGSLANGGYLGIAVAWPFVKLFDTSASLIFLSAFVVISVLIAFNDELDLKSLFSFSRDKKEKDEDDYEEEVDVKLALPLEEAPAMRKEKTVEKPKEERKPEKGVKVAAPEEESKDFIRSTAKDTGPYTPPPLSLLERDKGRPETGDVKANANIIKRTLANFGIDVEMDEVSIGPSVTRYAFKPAEGVKLSRIVALQNDLALALAAHPLRIEAPIPGKSLVGIEIPNTTKTTVGLGTLFSTEEFQTSEKPLLVSLGKGISGKSHFANVAKMPHLLIAGATGSGKSVTIHALIVSLLYRMGPDKLKFIMIDPKRVELTLYNKIPHLLTPVITDAKKAILSLKWAAKEMDRRYDILQGHGVRDIESYHKNIFEPSLKKVKVKKDGEEGTEKPLDAMPYIVVIIDELADIMQTYPRELEAGIVRLAQMSRAVGIHLMLSTQRPSVNVITGLIKANIPARLALQVASQIDSRTILDQPGAEKLLGAGDMLYLSGEMSKPTRIQCAYISENEVKKVAKFLADSHATDLPDEINLTENAVKNDNAIFSATLDDSLSDPLGSMDEGGGDGGDDDMYEEAKRVVIEAGKASTSYIQRKLRVGYSRAARLMDLLEEKGVIGPADGSKPRTVIGGGSPDAGIGAT
ncbi:MAG TPA: DNA translocase FtsK 4TM domain-containing protein, partial [Candidatus Paceibacterota bacterium]|nr:DNA translocase FtsK 4TM domain-containing protein [Candidatus Paceibacterota bacterium]